ncbi:hypothetical protein ACOMHN_019989 [Nucella lapillus]
MVMSLDEGAKYTILPWSCRWRGCRRQVHDPAMVMSLDEGAKYTILLWSCRWMGCRRQVHDPAMVMSLDGLSSFGWGLFAAQPSLAVDERGWNQKTEAMTEG